jgi:hypothetical protein
VERLGPEPLAGHAELVNLYTPADAVPEEECHGLPPVHLQVEGEARPPQGQIQPGADHLVVGDQDEPGGEGV